MKVLQLIDSLNAGGAERVAVNVANALVTQIEKSYLCTTRAEGLLKEALSSDVGYLFLSKKSAFDKKAIKKLNSFIKAENISIVHAHSSSYFLATIIKRSNKNLKIVWHDHYGNRPNSSKLNRMVLKQCSKAFSYIFCVNKNLETWAKSYLKFSKISYLANFVSEFKNEPKTKLFGIDNKRILCLANLRPDKDHITLVRAFKKVLASYPNWTLHCVGKDFKDEYSKHILKEIQKLELNESIFFYGSVPDVSNVLKQTTIAVLSSKSEGLPMSLLEYGLAALPVVVTDVGDCAKVICNGDKGLLVEPQNDIKLAKAITVYIENKSLRENHSRLFNKHVKTEYSVEKTVKEIVNVYKEIVIE